MDGHYQTDIKDPNVIHFETVECTMDTALDFLQFNKDLLIIADEQLKGRGRKENVWYSPPGGLWVTFVFRINLNFSQQQFAILHSATAISVYNVLKEYISEYTLQVKKPNDVLVDGKKIAGVLIESVKGQFNSILIGVGINTNFRVNKLPHEIRDYSITLLNLLNHKVDNIKLALALYYDIKEKIGLIIKEEYKLIDDQFNEICI